MGHANDSSTGPTPTPERLARSTARRDGTDAPAAGPNGSQSPMLSEVLDTVRNNPKAFMNVLTGQTGSAYANALLAAGPTIVDMTPFLDSPQTKGEGALEEMLKNDPFAKAFKGVPVTATQVGDRITVEHEKENGVEIEQPDGSKLWVPGKSNPKWPDKATEVKAKITETHDKAAGTHKYELSGIKGLMGSEPPAKKSWIASLGSAVGATDYGYVDTATLTHNERLDNYNLHIEGARAGARSKMDLALKPEQGEYLVRALKTLKEKGVLAQKREDAAERES